MAIHNERGKLGEDNATKFLIHLGHHLLYRNKRLGREEIDIITEKDKIIHLVEVKTVLEGSRILPTDNLTYRKWKHLLHSANILENKEFHGKHLQIDLACVYLNYETRKAKVTLFENIRAD